MRIASRLPAQQHNAPAVHDYLYSVFCHPCPVDLMWSHLVALGDHLKSLVTLKAPHHGEGRQDRRHVKIVTDRGTRREGHGGDGVAAVSHRHHVALPVARAAGGIHHHGNAAALALNPKSARVLVLVGLAVPDPSPQSVTTMIMMLLQLKLRLGRLLTRRHD